MTRFQHARRRMLSAVTVGILAAVALVPAAVSSANAAPGDRWGFDDASKMYFQYDSENLESGATITHFYGDGDVVFPTTVRDNNAQLDIVVKTLGILGGPLHGEHDRVVIPDSVTKIYPGAFDPGEGSEDYIGELILGTGVTELEAKTFKSSNVRSVVLPATLTKIGDEAFADNQLTSITFPASVSSIGTSAFAENDLTSVTFTDGLTNIDPSAFAENNITSIALPSSLQSMGDAAFYDNEIASLTIENGVTSIAAGAFRRNKLTSVAIPDSVVSIKGTAFFENQISSVTLGSGLTEVGEEAFVANQITELTLPASLRTMGSLSFANNQISKINFAEGLTEIGSNVFLSNQLTSLELPSTVTTIGEGAFALNQFAELVLPNQVTTIESGAFLENQLTKVTLGNQVDTIGELAFGENPNLTRVIFTGPVPTNILPGNSEDASLGHSPKLIVLFQPQFGKSNTPGGFTSPMWKGYNTFPASVTVTFATNGGKPIASRTVKFDERLTLPTSPIRTGKIFSGWYTDSALKSPFSLNHTFKGDITLYAGWKPKRLNINEPISGTKPGASGGLTNSGSLANTGGSNAELMAAAAAAALLLAAGATVLARRKSASKQ